MILVILIGIFVFAEVKAAEVVTIYEYSIGGGGSSDDTSGSGSSTYAYDCTDADSCPRWFLMSQDQYKTLINGGEDNFAYGSEAYGNIKEICQNTNDKKVVVAANFKLSNYQPIGNSLDSIRIFNFTDESVGPTKKSHVYTSVVKSDGSVETKTDWSDTDPYQKGFFADKVEGKDITYGDLMKKIASDYGVDETQLAVACMSMIEGGDPVPAPEPEPEKVSLIGVSIDVNGKFLGVKNVVNTVKKGSTASITRLEVTDYSFKGWKETKNATSYSSTNATYSVSSLSSTKTVYAVYEKNIQTYYSKSSVGITYADVAKKYGTTGIKKSLASINAGLKIDFGGRNVLVGESVTMIFSQLLYADLKEDNVSWNINRIRLDGRPFTPQMISQAPKTFSDSDAYTITETKSTQNNLYLSDGNQFGATSGTVNFGDSSGYTVPKYIASSGSRNYTDNGTNRYVHRDVYSVTFKKAGYYKFCEWIGTKGSDTVYYYGTMGCAYFNVIEQPEKVTLTGKAYDTNGNYLGSSYDVSSGAVDKGSSASVTRKEISGYTFKGWKEYLSASNYSVTNVKYSVTSLNANKTVYAIYEKSGQSTTNNYTLTCKHVDAKGNAISGVYDSSSKGTEGSKVFVNRKATIDGYTFKEWRTGTSFTGSRLVNSTSTSNATYISSDTLTFYVKTIGMNTTAYAVYEKNEVTSEFTGTAKVTCFDGKVEYNGGSNQAYCRSGDSVKFYGYSINRTKGSSETKYCVTDINGSCSLSSNSKSTTTNNKNPMDIEGKSASNVTAGNTYQVGLSYYASASSSSFSNEANVGAVAKVPYNFTNSVCIVDSNENCIKGDMDEPVSIGQQIDTKIKITVGKRYNTTIGGTYATRVDNAKWKIEMSTDGGKTWSGEVAKSGSLNSDNKLDGYSETKSPKSPGVPDMELGKKVCYRAAVYPADSGGKNNDDLAMNKSWPNNSWATSDMVCYTIAKKPSIQVWGGGMFTNGNISIPLTTKNVEGKTYAFGSWVEQGVLRAGGTLQGMGSGASIGYKSGKDCSNKITISCISPLTITNKTINNVNLTDSGVLSRVVSENYKKSLIDVGAKVIEPSGNDSSSLVDSSSNIYRDDNKIVVERGTTNVFRIDGDFSITSNIVYSDGGYTGLSDIPKLIIYADNINISCYVERIDAVLITEGIVNTCSEGTKDNINAGMRSTQLKINGSIIANRLVAGRTYGAGTGIYSIIPAEIIDYDTSLYLWSLNGDSGSPSGGGSGSGQSLDVVYSHELAPRI